MKRKLLVTFLLLTFICCTFATPAFAIGENEYYDTYGMSGSFVTDAVTPDYYFNAGQVVAFVRSSNSDTRISSYTVELLRSDGVSIGKVLYAPTNGTTSLTFTNVPAGYYHLHLSKPSYTANYAQTYEVFHFANN